jgi:hypothetical protein
MTLTANALAGYIGRQALLITGGLTVGIVTRDAKQVFGRTRVLVVPIVGTGQQWVEPERLLFTEKGATIPLNPAAVGGGQ